MSTTTHTRKKERQLMLASIEDAKSIAPLAVQTARQLQDDKSDEDVFDTMREWNIRLGDAIEDAYVALAKAGADENVAATLMSAFYIQQGTTIAFAARGAKSLGLDDVIVEADGSPLRV